MNKNKIIILVLLIAAMMVFNSGTSAANPSLYVSPATASKNMNSAFDITVKVNPSGEKVCAVEGQLLLPKFVVQKIDLAQGIMPQTSPSYSNNLSFLLGIPGCTTESINLFTVRVKSNTVGNLPANFRNVDIIGEGVSLGSASASGNYEITIPPTPSVPSTPSTPSGEPPAQPVFCVCEDWGAWQNRDCGQGDCVDTQRLQERIRVCAPLGCDVEKQAQCINDLACIASAKEKPEVAETVPQSSFLASIGNAVTQSIWFKVIAILSLFGLAGIGARQWLLSQKKK